MYFGSFNFILSLVSPCEVPIFISNILGKLLEFSQFRRTDHRPVSFVSDKTDNAGIGNKVREDSETLDMTWRGHTRQVTFY